MAQSVDALLFDLGRVVIDIDFDRAFSRWATHAGCDPAVIKARFTHDSAYRRHERGEIGSEEYFASLRSCLGISISEAQLLDGWNAIFIGEMAGMAPLLASLARQMPLYAFTNSNRAHELYWSKQFSGILSHFRQVYVSSSIGMRKPTLEAFAHVVKAVGASPERIVFFDDLRENVEGALAARLQAFQVSTSADVANALATILP